MSDVSKPKQDFAETGSTNLTEESLKQQELRHNEHNATAFEETLKISEGLSPASDGQEHTKEAIQEKEEPEEYEGVIKKDVQPPEDAVLHEVPEKELEKIKSTLETLKDIKTPYASLSKLKQQRALKRANKILKAEGLKPMTHKDMLESTDWNSIHKADEEVVKSLVVTMTTLANILEHPKLPDEFKQSESYADLKKYYVHGIKIMDANIRQARKLLRDKDGNLYEGGVSTLDMNPYAEAFDAYNQIRTDLVQLLGYITDPVSILLAAIKITTDPESVLPSMSETIKRGVTKGGENNEEEQEASIVE